MSYPADTLFGVGQPRIKLVPANASPDERILRSLDGAGAVARIVECIFDWSSETEIWFTPERFDGGDAFVQLADGRIVNRAHGWRIGVRIQWAALNASDARELLRAYNHSRHGGIWLCPHDDFQQRWFDVVFVTPFTPGSPAGLYLGHSFAVEFRGRQLLRSIPEYSSSEAVAVMRPAFGMRG